MKRIKDFLKENKALNKNSLASALGGAEGHSYWEDYVSTTCITKYYDTFDDINGDGHRNAGESATLCSETECIDPCPET